MPSTLDKITDFPALVDYLRDELEWPIAADIGLDEATYDITPEEIGLKSSVVGGGIEIKQLRPLNRAQPWGVFFLNLPSTKLPVTLVRNILGKLAIKKRASANKSEQAAFAKHDLLFIAATGSAPDRRLAFAHFADDEVTGDAATLKVLGWDADDTPRRLDLTEASLKTKLRWPDDPADVDHWRKQWGEAFAHADTRTVVRESKQMAKELAGLAKRIRARAKALIDAQTDKGSLMKLFKGFQEALLHELKPEGFADLYAQTISYGLLSAAISRSSGALVQDNIRDTVTITSPFLRDILGMFLEAGGRREGRTDQALDFDELGVTEVVDLLRAPNTDMKAVLADFDRRKPGEDPVTHLYEDFMLEYDRDQKVRRGVFYTPKPVVGFIVRSVDEVLRTTFRLEDGLASTVTWGEVIAASKDNKGAEITLPEGAKASDPFVRILDPATGTGTFLVECIDLIHKTMVAKWKAAGKRGIEIKTLWNAYVPAHLLPRLTGFELMMAPYAIAHVKLGLKLADTGYTFGNDARAQIYLTNALEPAQDMDMQLAFMSEALAHEAKAANEAKETRFTVVVGNPPYSKISGNLSNAAVKWVEPFRYLDGEKIRERGALAFEMALQDDYVKFWGFSHASIKQSALGIAAFITNFRYLDGRYLRGLRYRFLEDFISISVTNLGGQVAELHASDENDENVFDIEQGVAVAVCTLSPSSAVVERSYRRIFGSREQKYATIADRSIFPIQPLRPTSPDYFLVSGFDDPTGDPSWPRLDEIFELNSGSIITSRDALLINFDAESLADAVTKFSEAKPGNTAIFEELDFSAKASWNIEAAKASVRQALKDKTLRHFIRSVAYRPFDKRHIYFDQKLIDTPSKPVSDAIYGSRNLVLLSPKVKTLGAFTHVFVADAPAEKKVASHDRATQMFALYKAPNKLHPAPLPAIAPAFANRVAELTGLAYDDCVEGQKQGALGGILPEKAEQTVMFAPARRERGEPGNSFGPRDLFDYIYAVLHSLAYRARYADYLKSDFARVPLPGSCALFEALVPLGTELVALHLLDAEVLPNLKDPKGIRLAGSGDARVAHKPEFDVKLGRVTINATRWFEGVSQVAWDFHVGGYQPAQKWLKDRAARGGKKASDGRILSDDDVVHYRRMIVALTRTSELMPQIDAVVEQHGGWPGAFVVASSTAPVQLPALSTLPDGSWTWLSSIQPRDRLRYAAQHTLWQMDPAKDASRLRFVIASLAEPALLTPLLSDDDRAAWLRLIGRDAQLSAGVVRLRPEVNGAWRAMFETMITSGQLTEQSDGSWSRGQYFSETGLNAVSVDAQRAAFVLHAIRMIELSDLQAAVAPEDNVIWANFGNG